MITTGEIWDIEYIGNRVFIAGTSRSIQNNTATNTTTYNQPAWRRTTSTPAWSTPTFRPTFSGGGVTEVEASPDGTKLFVGGPVQHRQRRHEAEGRRRSTRPPARSTTGFTANTNNAATRVAATNTTVYVGGQFTPINGATRASLAAVNATTGAVVTGLLNNLSGGIGVNGALTVQALMLTHDESKLLVVHTGRQIDGQDRYGVGLIDTATNQLLPWRTRLWDDNLQFVGGVTAHLRRRHLARRLSTSS